MTTTTLAQALNATHQTISVSSGTLALNDVIAVGAEYCQVSGLITATQAFVRRGVNGSSAGSHNAGDEVQFGAEADFLTGPQVLPPFGFITDVLTAQGPTDAATFEPAASQLILLAGQLAGRGSASGSGEPEAITVGANLSLIGTTLSATGGGAGSASFVRPFLIMGG